jgi:hypothetical protein
MLGSRRQSSNLTAGDRAISGDTSPEEHSPARADRRNGARPCGYRAGARPRKPNEPEKGRQINGLACERAVD